MHERGKGLNSGPVGKEGLGGRLASGLKTGSPERSVGEFWTRIRTSSSSMHLRLWNFGQDVCPISPCVSRFRASLAAPSPLGRATRSKEEYAEEPLQNTSPKASPFWEGAPRFRQLASRSLSGRPAPPILPEPTHSFLGGGIFQRLTPSPPEGHPGARGWPL